MVSVTSYSSQSPTKAHQVSMKTTSTAAPWTPAPPVSPRQRTHSPLRWMGPQTQPASAVVLTRDPAEEPKLEINQERLTRKTSLDMALRMPFFNVSAGHSQSEKTPKR